MFDPTPINNFMARVRQAAAMNAKDIKLTTSEALNLSACLVQLLSSQIVTALSEKSSKAETPPKPVLDGGVFTKSNKNGTT